MIIMVCDELNHYVEEDTIGASRMLNVHGKTLDPNRAYPIVTKS